jgi:hypothetical protein
MREHPLPVFDPDTNSRKFSPLHRADRERGRVEMDVRFRIPACNRIREEKQPLAVRATRSEIEEIAAPVDQMESWTFTNALIDGSAQ